jgi:3-oxoacyl-[acyl-carrier-protein] synthase III
MVSLLSCATSVPRHAFRTSGLVASLRHKLSPELVNTIGALGVEQRFSAIENFPEFLEGRPMRATSSATALGAAAARRCLEEWGGDPRRVGLLIAATNTPAQLLPCLASEVMADLHGVLSRSISTVSMQAQGCSVLLKTVEVARWYLVANPSKLALILLSEAHTPYITPPTADEYFGYREIARLRRGGALGEEAAGRRRLDTTLLVQAMLFGDGAVALLVGREEGLAEFGPVTHLTNDEPGDVGLLTMGGGSLEPCLAGRPVYFMRPSVPTRGAHYAVTTVRRVLADPDSRVHDLSDVRGCLIHTGSKKILDGVCAQLDIAPGSPKVRSSYEVLKTYGNLSSASTGFMLAAGEHRPGPAVVVGFGVGFTASAGVVNFN